MTENTGKRKRLRDCKFLLYSYQIYKCLIFYPLLGLSTLMLVFTALPYLIVFGEKKAQIFGKFWGRFNSIITPMFVSVSGRENIDPKQSYVITADHKSQYDIFAVYGSMPADFRWVMKKELRKVPILGYMAERGGHISIDRSDSKKAIETLEAAKTKIKDGTSVFFFPEGTRGPEDRMLPFKKGAFKMSIDMGLPILPVSITGTADVLPNNSTMLFPGKAQIIIHKPVSTEGYTSENIQELMDKVRDIIDSGIKQGL